LKAANKQWVESCLSDGDNFRGGKWTESIAVGSKPFIENVKVLMGGMALGRKVLETGESFQLKEVQYPYIALLGAKKSEILVLIDSFIYFSRCSCGLTPGRPGTIKVLLQQVGNT